MYPEIRSGGELKAILNNITSNNLTHRINNKYFFKMSCVEEEYKTNYITTDNQIYINKDQIFDINHIEVGHDSSNVITYDVEAEHVTYRLIKQTIDRYANTGTPIEILTDLLANTEFTVNEIDFNDSIVFAVNKLASKLEIVIALANVIGGKLVFSNYGIGRKE